MPVAPSVFQNIPFDVNAPSACTPELPGGDWLGLRIRTPDLVYLERDPASRWTPTLPPIALCGAYLLDVPATPADTPMQLVVNHDGWETPMTVPLTDTDPSPMEPPPPSAPLPPEDVEGLVAGGYFHYNLLDFLTLPPIAAVYSVSVEFRGYASNSATIDIRESP